MIPLTRRPPPLIKATGGARERALARAPQAEWGLAHQGARVLLSRDQSSGWLVRRAGWRLVALGLPLGPAALDDLRRTARALGLSPMLYKCDAVTACAARRQGWRVRRTGHEAVLDLGSWSLDRPACRQLRRKLRASRDALTIELAGSLPLDRMQRVAREWAVRSGGERGFSMGRLDLRLLRHQRVLLAWQGETLVAFASFHVHGQEWTLDLMRHSDAAPNGTMHRLVVEAVAQARAAGARRLSLAAIPEPLPMALGRAARPCGLAQFKLSFGPRLLPRYAAAPGGLSLLSGLLQVARAVHRPAPLTQDGPTPWIFQSCHDGRGALGEPETLGLNPGPSRAMRGLRPLPCPSGPAIAERFDP